MYANLDFFADALKKEKKDLDEKNAKYKQLLLKQKKELEELRKWVCFLFDFWDWLILDFSYWSTHQWSWVI